MQVPVENCYRNCVCMRACVCVCVLYTCICVCVVMMVIISSAVQKTSRSTYGEHSMNSTNCRQHDVIAVTTGKVSKVRPTFQCINILCPSVRNRFFSCRHIIKVSKGYIFTTQCYA